MLKRRKRYIFFVIILSILMCGCGKKSNLETYKDDMATFYQDVSTTSSNIDAIDPNSEDAVNNLLTQLDAMNASFQSLAAMEVPEEFSSCESLADDAATYMNDSVTLYHQAFEGETYQADLAAQAKEKYEIAMQYLEYIGQLLMGEIPEGEGVTVSSN